MTLRSTLLHFQNMLLHRLLITFLGMGEGVDLTNSKMAQQLLQSKQILLYTTL